MCLLIKHDQNALWDGNNVIVFLQLKAWTDKSKPTLPSAMEDVHVPGPGSETPRVFGDIRVSHLH